MSIVHSNQDCFLVLFFQNILEIRLLLYQNNNSGNKKTLLSRISFYLFLIVCFDSLGINTSPCLHQEKLHFFGRTPLPTTETSNFFFLLEQPTQFSPSESGIRYRAGLFFYLDSLRLVTLSSLKKQ